jgi:hypothetical protein
MPLWLRRYGRSIRCRKSNGNRKRWKSPNRGDRGAAWRVGTSGGTIRAKWKELKTKSRMFEHAIASGLND